ncbi:hypothetical protein [Limimaricola cinnabarinus]|uniref:Uncharacterized protein n=1 Tax=Limimaricola cinnabarinus LL-001 TaxID=1337093 RepID=U2Z5R3_9RHOB|nr:hypothetical protein [Limimaricola cinnabarinus]GAD56755.1 hypothetical protein MBELCI_2807 [Limimaricola cinnabarinus LL-001]
MRVKDYAEPVRPDPPLRGTARPRRLPRFLKAQDDPQDGGQPGGGAEARATPETPKAPKVPQTPKVPETPRTVPSKHAARMTGHRFRDR